MKKAAEAAIDVVEASYNLDIGSSSEWLANLLEHGEDLFARGFPFGAAVWSGLGSDGNLVLTGMELSDKARFEEYALKIAKAFQEVGPTRLAARQEGTRGKSVEPVSEESPSWGVLSAFEKHLGCKDVLFLNAHDHDHHGFSLLVPCDERLTLSAAQRSRLRQVAIHMGAGHRIWRNALPSSEVAGASLGELPLNAEALLDPARFTVSDLADTVKDGSASTIIRDAAKRLDKARGKMRRAEPDQALEIWKGLVNGRWSLVDWFDTDGRRFVLAKPNAPRITDPRGLSEQEAQVATYAALGETGKILSYRFGLSTQRVSILLRSAMRKLGVKTQAQLVDRMRGAPGPFVAPEG